MSQKNSAAIKMAFLESREVLQEFLDNPQNLEKTFSFGKKLVTCFKAENKVFSFGNGGSMCDARHFAEEFTGRYRKDRRPLPALAPLDSSHITCTANDYGFDKIFSRSVEAFGRAGDIVLAISTSGNSPNVIEAVKAAKKIGIFTFALLGKNGGKLKELADDFLIMPGKNSDRIQEMHIKFIHIVIEFVERELFPELYTY
ncbi:SIS domain-containing protein [Candidatus Riflebacteria bacterium]